jgi:hypothetical protein
MSTTDAFSDVLGERMSGKANRGVPATRKVQLASYEVPYAALDEHGVEIPHREFNTDAIREYPTTVTLDGEDGPLRVHLFQDVRERGEDAYGDYGAATEDVGDVTWTIDDLANGTVTLKVVGEWNKEREISFADFPDEYEPITCETPHGVVPRFGY